MFLLTHIIYPLLFPFRFLLFSTIGIFSILAPKRLYEYCFKTANYLILLSLGIRINNIIDNRKNDINTEIIVFQHRCYADCFMVNYVFGIVGYVFRNIFKNNLIIKYYINKYNKKDVKLYFNNPQINEKDYKDDTINLFNKINNDIKNNINIINNINKNNYNTIFISLKRKDKNYNLLYDN